MRKVLSWRRIGVFMRMVGYVRFIILAAKMI